MRKSFGDHLIWDNVNMKIEDGETIAIIGKSGSGKSVLLKHINALLYPDSGSVIIDGADIFKLDYVELRKIRQRFGVLFQGAALFDSINTFENVAFPLRYFTRLNEEEIEAKVIESLKLVDLENVSEKSTAELSGGMRKRVGLARAIVMQPAYILYDEPTSGLDPETSDEINDLIIHMSENLDITSVVVTHDIHSVLKIADKAAFIADQEIAWSGTVAEMKTSDDERLINFIKASEYQIG